MSQCLSKPRIAFLVQSDLEKDARVINVAKILESRADLNCEMVVSSKSNPLEFPIKINNFYLRNFDSKICKYIYFFFCSIIYILKGNFDVLHVHDELSTPIAIAVKVLSFRRKLKIIYDDHELPERYYGWLSQIFLLSEKRVIELCDLHIVASRQRLELYKALKYKIKAENMTYYNNVFIPARRSECEYTTAVETDNRRIVLDKKLKQIELLRSKGNKIILHQGSLNKGRCEELLARLIVQLDDAYTFAFVGISEDELMKFLNKYSVSESRALCFGAVPYYYLNRVWCAVDMAVIFYSTESMNNNYCAPNRFFLAWYHELPVIYNTANVGLSMLTQEYGKIGSENELNIIPSTMKDSLSIFRHKVDYDTFLDSDLQRYIRDYKVGMS